ncbi:MAG: hypothetical protein JW943_03285 [Deltaproteobacteria bacterium]|nr:hypothetical protein [Deltaproteobacteria bacterium]
MNYLNICLMSRNILNCSAISAEKDQWPSLQKNNALCVQCDFLNTPSIRIMQATAYAQSSDEKVFVSYIDEFMQEYHHTNGCERRMVCFMQISMQIWQNKAGHIREWT